jgi:hypothetical protein
MLLYPLQDITVIFRRRGGCDLVQSFSDWKGTVASAPDVIGMTFLSIVSLVDDVPGKKHLARAVELYLTCKICFRLLSFVLCSYATQELIHHIEYSIFIMP